MTQPKERKGKNTPFGVSLMRSQVIYRAVQEPKETVFGVYQDTVEYTCQTCLIMTRTKLACLNTWHDMSMYTQSGLMSRQCMVCCVLCLVYGCKGCQHERRWTRDWNWPAVDQLSRSREWANACSDTVSASCNDTVCACYGMLCAAASCLLKVTSMLYTAGASLHVT